MNRTSLDFSHKSRYTCRTVWDTDISGTQRYQGHLHLVYITWLRICLL